MPWRYAADSVNKSHLIDFAKRGGSDSHLGQPALPQSDHTFLARHALNFRGGAAINDHLANVVGKVEQLANRRSSMIPSAGTLQTSGALADLRRVQVLRFETGFLGLLGSEFPGAFAVRTN